MEELERSLAESRRHINSYAYGNNTPSDRMSDGSSGMGYTSQDDFARDLEEIQRHSYERQKAIGRGLGFGDPEEEEAAKRQRADSLARIRKEEAERNRPNLVIKSADTNADKFHTVAAPDGAAEARLIRAMIDQTTKAKEGTRLRFKLLDDVTVSGTKLRKGTYLYGTVTGFLQPAREGYHHQHTCRGQVHQGQAVRIRQRRHGGLLRARILVPRFREGR